MPKYKISTSEAESGPNVRSFVVDIEPPLTDGDRERFSTREEVHLLEQFHLTSQGRERYMMQTSDLEVKCSLDQKTRTAQDVIESAAVRMTAILKSAGNVVELFLNGELQEEAPVEESLVDEQTDPIAG